MIEQFLFFACIDRSDLLNRLCPLNLSIEIKLRVLKSKKLFLINHRTFKEKCQDISIEKRKKISIKMVFLKDG
ncbi:hypothetical protein AAX20_05980 [Oenococcus oeni]|nr:hypothetical protein AAX20_05980 [Oenococcus oeni]